MSRKEYTEAYEQEHTDALKEILEIAEACDDTYMVVKLKQILGYD